MTMAHGNSNEENRAEIWMRLPKSSDDEEQEVGD